MRATSNYSKWLLPHARVASCRVQTESLSNLSFNHHITEMQLLLLSLMSPLGTAYTWGANALKRLDSLLLLVEVDSHFFGFEKSQPCSWQPWQRRGCSSSSFRPWACKWRTINVCDAWPVRRQTYGYLPSCKASPPIVWYQIIPLGDRGTCVLTTCPGLHSRAGRLGFEPVTYWSQVWHPTAMTLSHTIWIWESI